MPPGTLEQIVFRMDALGQLESSGVTVINPPRAVEAAVDKYLTTARLAAAGLRVPRTVACQTADDALHTSTHLARMSSSSRCLAPKGAALRASPTRPWPSARFAPSSNWAP